MSFVGDDNPLIKPTLLNPATWCPDKSTWNPQTSQCETFGETPPMPIRKSWAWWQWAILVGSIGFVGVVGYEAHRRHRRPAIPSFFPFGDE